MNTEYNYGLAGGILSALMIVMIWRIIRHFRGEDGKPEYDERQQAARGIAYRNGFHVLGTYVILYGVLDLFGISFCEVYVGMIIGLLAGAGAFAITAIRNDAYVSLNQKSIKLTRWGYVLAAANLIPGVMGCVNGTVLQDGKLAAPAVSLLLGVVWVAIMLVFHAHQRRSAAEEGEEP